MRAVHQLPRMRWVFQVVCMCILVVIAHTQELQSCSVDAVPSTISSTQDAETLATSILACPEGSFAVEWVGEVFVAETIHVTDGTSLNITGSGSGAIADGRDATQLFIVDRGARLDISDMTFAHGNAILGGAVNAFEANVSFSGNTSLISNSASADGGAIYAHDATVSWDGDGTKFIISNTAGGNGGAIYVSRSQLSLDGDGTEFISNTSGEDGGAIYTGDYTVFSRDGDDTEFISNAAGGNGGAMYSDSSIVSWDGDGAEFSNNSAGEDGGAIGWFFSTVSWDGDGADFSNNSAGGEGGAIYFQAHVTDSFSWDGDGTKFISNTAGLNGGAIYVVRPESDPLYWYGDGTEFISNSAVGDGGAIYASTTWYWYGGGQDFSNNSAVGDGGAIALSSSIISLGENTTFSSNVAGENGGALAVEYLENDGGLSLDGATFINNHAGSEGGAMYLFNCVVGINFTDFTFQSNMANGDGGAVAALAAGREGSPVTLVNCAFVSNKADGAGGAVEVLVGQLEFISCEFEGNSADVGGALRLGGTTIVRDCSFLSNSASRGLAVAVIASASISGSSFERNELVCEAGSYRADTEEGGPAMRFETVCFDCPGWDECSSCTIESGDITPTCEAPLEHTSADAHSVTLETLHIDEGYWRATTKSDNILACYNEDACSGGQTGVDSFCASGYTGPYCAVCETEYSTSFGHTCTRCSSSRRHGLMAVTVIAALVAVLGVVTIFNLLLSTEVEEKSIGCFQRRVLRAVPVQPLKIVVVVWQILTQFADAAFLTYPGAYQDFLSVIDFINFDFGSLLAAGCLWTDIDFHDRLVVSTLGPLVAIGFLVMTYAIAVRRNGAPGDTAMVAKIFHRHLTALLLLTFLVYSSVSSMVFQTFACETLDDGIEYLRADYRIHCTDAKHKIFEAYAGIMILVYPVGIPLLYAFLLFQRRDVLAHAGADKTRAQSISGLWEPYTPERFYYELIECGRRVMLTGVVVFIFPNDSAQIAITMLIALFFLVVFEILLPYKSETDVWLSRGGHVIVFLSMFDLLLLKVDVSGERDESQAAFAGVLVAGHVLMILAIVVEVVGFCYASGKRKAAIEVSPSERPSASRPRVGSGDVLMFESAPPSWRSFLLRESVSESTGPIRSISGNVVAH